MKKNEKYLLLAMTFGIWFLAVSIWINPVETKAASEAKIGVQDIKNFESEVHKAITSSCYVNLQNGYITCD